MINYELLDKFYSAFKNGDAYAMAECYHENAEFYDPAFGQLNKGRPAKMWEMLLSNKASSPKINYVIHEAGKNTGRVDWTAEYFFGPDKRPVSNSVKSELVFNDGKIISQHDSFNFWRWSQQALGAYGYVLGWTPILKIIVRKMTNRRLDKFISK